MVFGQLPFTIFQPEVFLCLEIVCGVAPLYYRETTEGMYFASSIQSLVDIEPETVEVDEDKVVGFIQTSLKDFDNSTFYHQVKSVSPATVVTLSQEACRVENSKKIQYWFFPTSRLSPKDLSFDDAVTWVSRYVL